MIRFIITGVLLIQFLSAQVIVRKPVPYDIKEDAVAAVKVLAREVMKENYLYSFEKMYPRLKEDSAKKLGGEDKLKKRLADIPRQIQAKGISIIDLQTGKVGKSFEVNALHFNDSTKKPAFSEYLVFVPTTTLYRAVDPRSGAIKKIQIDSFQVAIRKINGGEWTFIDGSELSISQLRSLFPNLPSEAKELAIPQKKVIELE